MQHKHNPRQTSRAIQQKMRSNLIQRLSELLWDQSKPNGEEGIPEEQWHGILVGPCNGEERLIAEVCEYERNLRADMAEEDTLVEVQVKVAPKRYLRFVFTFFGQRLYPIDLLWNIQQCDWYPEDQWDQRLKEWTTGPPMLKDAMKEHARHLKEARETGIYNDRLPADLKELLS